MVHGRLHQIKDFRDFEQMCIVAFQLAQKTKLLDSVVMTFKKCSNNNNNNRESLITAVSREIREINLTTTAAVLETLSQQH